MVNNSNTVDDAGNSYYVVDTKRDRIVLGPYGSLEYARTCMARATYPFDEDLTVARSTDGPLGTDETASLEVDGWEWDGTMEASA